jgi:hypothetical protein
MTVPNPDSNNFSESDIQAYLRDREDFHKYLDLKRLPTSEYVGLRYASQIHEYILNHKGRFLCDDKGNYHVLIGNKRIPLKESEDNYALPDLFLKAVNVTTETSAARIAVKRLTNIAWDNSSRLTFKQFSARLTFKQFSAVCKDHQNRSSIYIPISTGEVLCIDASGHSLVANGDNEASLWLEHPTSDPLKWTPFGKDKVRDILEAFERLLVNTQACAVPEMRWFVAMHEGLFPYVRDTHLNRVIAVHRGGSQSGKTSGAQRFTKLHGLGAVKGDYSVAALRNMLDIGLLVLDNKEQANFTRDLIDYCLHLATGAEHGRSYLDGTLRTSGNDRPVGVITTIEGVPKTELQKRCVEIEYRVPNGVDKLRREPIESEISDLRHDITSALMPALETYLELRPQYIATPNPIPDFEEHFTTLCYLLRAYGRVTGRNPEWSETIISVWAKTLDKTNDLDTGGDLEETILWILRNNIGNVVSFNDVHHGFEHNGLRGRLYVTEAMPLLNALQQNTKLPSLPTAANGLSRRLGSTTMTQCQFLTADNCNSPILKRTSGSRPLGFFVAGEE